ncbi:hypothetical protein EVG20_g11421, partial [Dentipellis fragilis]
DRDRDLPPPPLPSSASRPSTARTTSLPSAQGQPFPSFPPRARPRSSSPAAALPSADPDAYPASAQGQTQSRGNSAEGLGRTPSGISFGHAPRNMRPALVSAHTGRVERHEHEHERGRRRGSLRAPALARVRERRSADANGVPPVRGRVQKPQLSVGDRLQPTLDAAEKERARAALTARMTGYALNIAIGMQVLLGALTTGLGAALTGKSVWGGQTSVAISILGGAATLVASYLARARGSNEPEQSLLRVQALEHFIREANAFTLDHGHEVGSRWDRELDGFRGAFEGMMGHPGRGVGGR